MDTESRLPAVEDIEAALGPIVASGLPVPPGFANETLLGLPGVVSRSANADDRLSRVKALEELLGEMLAKYPDDRLRQAVQVLFGVAPGSLGLGVMKRRERAAALSHYGATHFRKRIEKKILKELAWLLYRESHDVLNRSELATLSPDARRRVRESFWCMQETLLYLESFDMACRFIEEAHDWEEYYRTARVAMASRNTHSDAALWACVHLSESLGALEQDEASRRFLGVRLSADDWWNAMNIPFGGNQGTSVRQILIELEPDEPDVFAEAVLQAVDGPLLYRQWLDFLGSVPAKQEDGETVVPTMRDMLHGTLVASVKLLGGIFPDDIRPAGEVGATADRVVRDLVVTGPVMAGFEVEDAAGIRALDARLEALRALPQVWIVANAAEANTKSAASSKSATDSRNRNSLGASSFYLIRPE